MKRSFILISFIALLSGCQPANSVDRPPNELESESVVERDRSSARVAFGTKAATAETVHPITWDDFFDGDDVTEPSERLKALRGETVTLTGWMGEVLNLGQGWFLLIPAPGADCPFCSEDGQFWNKIMIVFVEEPSALRYTKEQVQVTGRIDVGIKVDESNYKTMFRLYDAQFDVLP